MFIKVTTDKNTRILVAIEAIFLVEKAPLEELTNICLKNGATIPCKDEFGHILAQLPMTKAQAEPTGKVN